ncbi:MAG TPA: sulfatase-like hydrolase/transferase [bacterium]|nr:sulfatase-like hydrolase/transferase [bacterium]
MAAVKKRPNILFLFADDQRFDTIRELGNDTIVTPNMDKIVRDGVAFTHAFIQGGTTGAVCMPSRAMLHTGRPLFRIKDSGGSIPESHITMGEAFRKAGYRTFGTGKWHNGTQSYTRSFTDGAEIWFGGLLDHWNLPVNHFNPEGKYEKVPFCLNPRYSNETRYMTCTHINVGKHSSELLGESAMEFLEKHKDTSPFFMYVAFLAPHDPRTMPQKYLDMYHPEKIPLPPNFTGRHPFDNGELSVRDEMLAGFPRKPEEIKKHIAEYYAMITHLDAQIGRIIKTLGETGRLENTIILLAGDNGLAVGQHGLMGKQNMYEHSVRVPLVMSGAGIPKNERRDSPVYLFDIFPTLAELADISTPKSVKGASFAPVIKNPRERTRRNLFFAYRHCQRAVRDDRFKLIEYAVEGKRTTQLFDLQEDPFEMNNLAGDKKHKKVLSSFQNLIVKAAEEWNDRDERWGKIFWKNFKT